jgi:copper(I)-binding protein
VIRRTWPSLVFGIIGAIRMVQPARAASNAAKSNAFCTPVGRVARSAATMPRMDTPAMSAPNRILRVARVALCGALALPGTNADALFIVNQPWVKPGTRTSEAYMVLTSTEGAALIGVRSPVAARASLIAPGSRGAALKLPAGTAIALRPGADRIALTGLSRQLKLGERVALTLTIETAAGAREDIAVDAEVRKESPIDAERRVHRR